MLKVADNITGGVAGDVTDPVIIYTDSKKAIRRMGIRVLCMSPFFLWMYVVLGQAPNPDAILRLIILLELPIIYLIMARRLSQQKKPIVSLSSQGITVNTVGTQVGFIPWDEVKEVYTYRLGYKYVGITLKNPKTLYRRIGLKRSWLLMMNRAVAPLYRPFGVRVAPISIPQEYLPMTADELAAQIQQYKDTYI